MNEVLKCLETRRSVRAYKPEQITDAELEAILNAGLYAPTGMNRQSAIMLVIQDKPLIEKLSKMNAYYMGKDMDAFYGAPTVIAVLADSNIRTHFEDGCLVLGNLMNAAHSLGEIPAGFTEPVRFLMTPKAEQFCVSAASAMNMSASVTAYSATAYPLPVMQAPAERTEFTQ